MKQIPKNELDGMDYPGRGVVMGITRNRDFFAAYFVTGRSPGSRNRTLEQREGEQVIFTQPIGKPAKDQDPELIYYNAMMWHQGRVVGEEEESLVVSVSNGAQTDGILAGTLCGNLTLQDCLRNWSFEHDSLSTPRVSGRIIVPADPYNTHMEVASITMRKRGDKRYAVKQFFDVNPQVHGQHEEKGEAYVLPTYGGHLTKTPAYRKEPFTIGIQGITPKGICFEIADALSTERLVGVAALVVDQNQGVDVMTLNKANYLAARK
jgi:IMP cyclohydrolase